mmetsp:Transcript_7666/g.15194  ORF Transcript_7666/g.15194 Transcript_7666/m.15194 type:complete len:213 (-) Transcript_7666:648-1286(-)
MRLLSGHSTVPAPGGQSPASTRNKDVLPHPFGPVTSTFWPSSTLRSRFCTSSRVLPWLSGALIDTALNSISPLLAETSTHVPADPPVGGSLVVVLRARKRCMMRCVNPASSSSFRPIRTTSEKAEPHLSINSSVDLNAEIRSASLRVVDIRNGIWMKTPPASRLWNLKSWSARSFLTLTRECHPRASTKVPSDLSSSVRSVSAPWRNATSSA